MKKIILIIFINILLFLIFLFSVDFLIFKYHEKNADPNFNSKFEYIFKPKLPSYMSNLDSFFSGDDNKGSGRLPDGLDFKNKPSIIIFGCSYAYGFKLNSNQTFSAKLSQMLKRPVYNRSISAGGFQHMYFQTLSDSLYKTIPQADTVIYIMINNHYPRLFLKHFYIMDSNIYPNYKVKNNKLFGYDYNNYILNFLNSLYIFKHFNLMYSNKYYLNPHNAEKLTDDILVYFTESRKNLQNHYGKNLKFYVLLYEDDNILYSNLLKEKLEKEGFYVISTQELKDIDLNEQKYKINDGCHPNEAAWDIITPFVINKLDLK